MKIDNLETNVVKTTTINSNCILVLHKHLQLNKRNTNENVYCYDLKHDAKTNLKAKPSTRFK